MVKRVIDTFHTTKGTKVKKIEDSSGRIQRFADGKQISSASYGAYKSHTPETEKFTRGNLEDIDSIEELGEPFTSTTYRSTDPDNSDLDIGTEERREAIKNNQWVGFLSATGTPDNRMKAAKEYTEMISELQGVENQRKREQIKESYNIGGS